MKGKTCVVTGASSGLGRETAIALAKLGANVVVVARDERKTAATVNEVKTRSGSSSVTGFSADFASQQSIRKLGDELNAALPRIDVLVNNAGVIMGERVLTPEGYETTFAVNHLGYFLVTHLLLDKLKASAPARIVSVASEAHQSGTIRFDDLNAEQAFNGWGAYCQSKLANILFTYELARRIEGSGVTANCLHPGVVATNFAGAGPGLIKFVFRLAAPVLLSPARGARTQIYLASSPEVEGVSGKYFEKCKPRPSNRESYDQSVASRLWEVSERMTGIA